MLLLYRQSTDVLLCSVCGYHYNVQRTECCLWRCVHGWRLESVVRDIYTQHGWQHSLQMGPVGYFSTLVEFVFVGFM
jgi:hypothetical protein